MINKYTNKQRGLLAVIMAMVMVFAGAAFIAAEVDAADTVEYTDVANGEELREALSTGLNVKFLDNITIDAEKGGYSVAGIIVSGGQIVNGNGYTLTVNNANDKYGCCIYITGGTIENLTINGAFRGIFTAGCDSDIIVKGCVIDNVCYTFNSDGSNDHNVVFTNTILNGWTSYTSGYKSVTFTDCEFGMGTGGYKYAFMRPYSDTTIIDSTFQKGFEFCLGGGAETTFVECNLENIIFDGTKGTSGYMGVGIYQITSTMYESESGYVYGDYVDSENGTVAVDNYVVNGIVVIPGGLIVTGTFTSDDNSILFNNVKAGTDGFTISKGSLVIDGDIVSGDDEGSSITVQEGTVKISGTVDTPIEVTGESTIEIQQGTTISEGITVTGGGVTITIGSGVDVDIVTSENVEVETIVLPGANVVVNGFTQPETELEVDGDDPQSIQDLIDNGAKEVIVKGNLVDTEVNLKSSALIIEGGVSGVITLSKGGSIKASSFSNVVINGTTVDKLVNATITCTDLEKKVLVVDVTEIGKTSQVSIDVGEGYTANIPSSVKLIDMMMTFGDATIVMKKVTVGTNGVEFEEGSVAIDGDLVMNEGSQINGDDITLLDGSTITGKGIIIGNISIPKNSAVTIGKGVVLDISNESILAIGENSELKGSGKIILAQKYDGEVVSGQIVNNGTIELEIQTGNLEVSVNDSEQFYNALPYYSVIRISDKFELEPLENGIYEFDVQKKTILGGSLTVTEEVVLNFIEVTYKAGDINVYGEFNISTSDIYSIVEIKEKNDMLGEVNIIQPKVMDVTGSTVGDLGDVGYGNVLNVAGDFTISNTNSVTIYGTLNVTGKLISDSGSKITVEGAGNIDVVGSIDLGGEIIITDGGKVDVTGTMNITGKLNGTIVDNGTVTFDGEAGVDAQIQLRDQVSITITSVDGTLTISDAGAVKAAGYDETKDNQCDLSGNSIKITDVKSVSVALIVFTQMDKENENKGFLTTMEVTGTLSPVDDTGEVKFDASDKGINKKYSTITVPAPEVIGADETITIAKGITLTMSGKVNVEGTVAVAEDAKITNSGNLTVKGTVSVINKDSKKATIEVKGNGKINATYFSITKNSKTTGTYTGFDVAVLSIDSVDSKTLKVLGKQTANVTATIASGQYIVIDGELTIGDETSMTIVNGAKITNNNSIEVDGILVIEDYSTGYGKTAKIIGSDVVIEEKPKKTFMSLEKAISSGLNEIALNRNIVIDEDLTVPAEVKVKSDKYGIYVIKGAILTVDGAIELAGKTALPEIEDVKEPGNTILYISEKVDKYKASKLIVNGYVMYSPDFMDWKFNVSGAHFKMDVDKKSMYFISSVEYAAANCHTGYIAITGEVSTGDITFSTIEDNQELFIFIMPYKIGSEWKNTVLKVSSITLDNATFVHMDSDNDEGAIATLSGIVLAKYGDGTDNAMIDLDKASGFVIGSFSEVEGDVITYYTALAGEVGGDISVIEGVVTIPYLEIINDGMIDTTFMVASDATVNIMDKDGDGWFFSASGEYDDQGDLIFNDKTIVFIEGTVNVKGAVADICNADVTGTINIMDDDDDGKGNPGIVYVYDVTLTGAINVLEEEDVENQLDVGYLTIGSKPTTLGGESGSIVGEVTIPEYGLLKAYPGANLEGAKINWFDLGNVSEAKNTEFYINDVLYMTAYINEDSKRPISYVLFKEEFELIGYDVGLNYGMNDSKNTGLYLITNWYSEQSMAQNKALRSDDCLVDFEKIYAVADPAEIIGTISVGTGITLFVDGVPVLSGKDCKLTVGTHVVSIDFQANYDGSKATIAFNGVVVTDGKITIDSDMKSFDLVATGAVPSTGESTIIVDTTGEDDELSLTDILLIVLVVLIVIMAIIVALRMMRS